MSSATKIILHPYCTFQIIRRPTEYGVGDVRPWHVGIGVRPPRSNAHFGVVDFNDERKVKWITYEEFAKGFEERVELVGSPVPIGKSSEEASIRLQSFLAWGDRPVNEPEFDLLRNNCECFARFIATGDWRSLQLEGQFRSPLVAAARMIWRGDVFTPRDDPTHPLRQHPLPGKDEVYGNDVYDNDMYGKSV